MLRCPLEFCPIGSGLDEVHNISGVGRVPTLTIPTNKQQIIIAQNERHNGFIVSLKRGHQL